MFDWSEPIPGASRSPKMEFQTPSLPYTRLRLYLVPLPCGQEIVFNQFDWDFYVKGKPGSINYTCGVYKRTGSINNGYQNNILFTLMPNTTVAVAGYGAPNLLTSALAARKVLPPGHYYIGFVFEEAILGTTLYTLNAHTNNAAVTGDWLYYDLPALALPATLLGFATSPLAGGYIHQVGEQPFWAALTDIEDRFR